MSGRSIVKLAFVWGFGGALSALCVCAGLGNALAGDGDARALAWAPWNAVALANSAAQLVQTGDPRQAEKDARRAIARDATLASAYSSLGLIAADSTDTSRTLALFRYANRLSRRDLAAQLWLINNAAATGRENEALFHFDAALRTNQAAAPILFPILISASEDERLISPMASLLRRNPNWKWPFLAQLMNTGKSGRVIFELTRGMLNPTDPADARFAKSLSARLVHDGLFELAWAVYMPVALSKSPGEPHNADFNAEVDDSPFDWAFANDPTLNATQRQRPGAPKGDLALFAGGNQGSSGRIARQLIRLRPGQYRLGYQSSDGPSPAGPFALMLTCANSDIPLAVVKGLADVPPTCPAQWLDVVVGPIDDVTNGEHWIDAIRIRQIDGVTKERVG